LLNRSTNSSFFAILFVFRKNLVIFVPNLKLSGENRNLWGKSKTIIFK
jgi:hypothetical protein